MVAKTSLSPSGGILGYLFDSESTMSSQPETQHISQPAPPVDTVVVAMDDTVFPTFDSDEKERVRQQHSNVMMMLESPLMSPAARDGILETVNDAFKTSYTDPTPKPKGAHRKTDRSKSIQHLLRDPRFVRTSPYWSMDAIKPNNSKTCCFPVGRLNCADLKCLYEYTTGANAKQSSYQSAKLGIGHYLQ